jgi:hypothetical protein
MADAKQARRFTWAYLFGAVCPERGTGAALVMPTVSVEAMNKHHEHLVEISQCVSLGALALVLLDGVGWHASPRLVVPDNIVLLPLPPYAPELNSVDPSTGSGHLGVSAQQLAQPLRLGNLRGHPRSVLQRLE